MDNNSKITNFSLTDRCLSGLENQNKNSGYFYSFTVVHLGGSATTIITGTVDTLVHLAAAIIKFISGFIVSPYNFFAAPHGRIAKDWNWTASAKHLGAATKHFSCILPIFLTTLFINPKISRELFFNCHQRTNIHSRSHIKDKDKIDSPKDLKAADEEKTSSNNPVKFVKFKATDEEASSLVESSDSSEILEANTLEKSQNMIVKEMKEFYDEQNNPLAKSKYNIFINDLLGDFEFCEEKDYVDFHFQNHDSVADFIKIFEKINTFLETHKNQAKFIEKALEDLVAYMGHSSKSRSDDLKKIQQGIDLMRENSIRNEKNQKKQTLQAKWLKNLPVDQFTGLNAVKCAALKHDLAGVEREFKEKFNMKEIDLDSILQKLRDFKHNVENAQSLEDLMNLEQEYDFWQKVFFATLPRGYDRINYA